MEQYIRCLCPLRARGDGFGSFGTELDETQADDAVFRKARHLGQLRAVEGVRRPEAHAMPALAWFQGSPPGCIHRSEAGGGCAIKALASLPASG